MFLLFGVAVVVVVMVVVVVVVIVAVVVDCCYCAYSLLWVDVCCPLSVVVYLLGSAVSCLLLV